MNRLEEVTRAAARIIGMDLTAFEWSETSHGLIRVDRSVVPPDVIATFRPLANPADALILESALLMGARYEMLTSKSMAIFMSSADPRFKELGYMKSAPADDKAALLHARMVAATTFAGLCDLAENGHVAG
jgi:hypothetical protein